jgi:transmembrane sensor
MSMSDYEDLLKRCLEKTATQEEKEEFNRILTDIGDDHKNQLFDPLIERIREIKEQEQISSTEIDQQKVQEIFNSMVASNSDMIRLEEIACLEDTANLEDEERKPLWWKFAAAATVTLAIGAGLYFYGIFPRWSADQTVAVTEKANDTWHTFSGKRYFYLPDGSKVTLNEGSSLSYDQSLGTDTRNVYLSGEAFFDIQHDPTRPFIVHTGKFTTTVLGTKFNVRAYERDQKIIVTVKQGKVKVGDDENRQYGTITPNEQIAVNTTTRDFVKAAVDAEAELAWKGRFVILDATTMEEAARILEEKYHVKISLANDQLKKCRITSTFLNDEKLDDVLAVVTTAVNATYTLNGNIAVISGDGNGCE